MSATPQPRPEVLVYKELLPGDMRKLLGQSNDTPSGGGARDLRLPWRAFRTVMQRIFTETVELKNGKQIRAAEITYTTSNGNHATTTLEYWPATLRRPAEDRVSKVHDSPALADRLPVQDKGRVFVLFIRWNNGTATCHYAYEDDLRASNLWASEVRNVILGCTSDTELKNTNRPRSPLATMGFYDFLDGTGYCHANK